VKAAVVGFIKAHVALARAELEEIKGELARASALVLGAVACLVLLGFLLPIGGLLFAGEWIYGSIGWGLLHGTLGLIAIAITAVLVAVRVPGLLRDVAAGVVIGIVVAVVLGASLPNLLFTTIGDASALAVDPAVRPLVIGVGIIGAIGALAGLIAGIKAGGAKGGIGGLFAGLVAGALAGAFLAITFGPRVGIAIGLAAFYIAWVALMGFRVGKNGIDTDALKARFIPQQTIDTTKETIEWAKARVPNGPRS